MKDSVTCSASVEWQPAKVWSDSIQWWALQSWVLHYPLLEKGVSSYFWLPPPIVCQSEEHVRGWSLMLCLETSMKFVMVSLTPGWWSNCAAHDQSYEAMTSDEMEIDTGKSEGPAWGICARTKSVLLQLVLSMHDERVLAIISFPGILLSGTGVRCQPYLQWSNFTAKEQFSVSSLSS